MDHQAQHLETETVRWAKSEIDLGGLRAPQMVSLISELAQGKWGFREDRVHAKAMLRYGRLKTLILGC